VVELALHKTPCNEIGSQTLDELEKFVDALDSVLTAHALIVHSTVPAGFSAGADLRELYHRSQALPANEPLPRFATSSNGFTK
jgi:enoyl-CoA hydratase/carnithine racemase